MRKKSAPVKSAPFALPEWPFFSTCDYGDVEIVGARYQGGATCLCLVTADVYAVEVTTLSVNLLEDNHCSLNWKFKEPCNANA